MTLLAKRNIFSTSVEWRPAPNDPIEHVRVRTGAVMVVGG